MNIIKTIRWVGGIFSREKFGVSLGYIIDSDKPSHDMLALRKSVVLLPGTVAGKVSIGIELLHMTFDFPTGLHNA